VKPDHHHRRKYYSRPWRKVVELHKSVLDRQGRNRRGYLAVPPSYGTRTLPLQCTTLARRDSPATDQQSIQPVPKVRLSSGYFPESTPGSNATFQWNCTRWHVLRRSAARSHHHAGSRQGHCQHRIHHHLEFQHPIQGCLKLGPIVHPQFLQTQRSRMFRLP